MEGPRGVGRKLPDLQPQVREHGGVETLPVVRDLDPPAVTRHPAGEEDGEGFLGAEAVVDAVLGYLLEDDLRNPLPENPGIDLDGKIELVLEPLLHEEEVGADVLHLLRDGGGPPRRRGRVAEHGRDPVADVADLVRSGLEALVGDHRQDVVEEVGAHLDLEGVEPGAGLQGLGDELLPDRLVEPRAEGEEGGVEGLDLVVRVLEGDLVGEVAEPRVLHPGLQPSDRPRELAGKDEVVHQGDQDDEEADEDGDVPGEGDGTQEGGLLLDEDDGDPRVARRAHGGYLLGPRVRVPRQAHRPLPLCGEPRIVVDAPFAGGIEGGAVGTEGVDADVVRPRDREEPVEVGALVLDLDVAHRSLGALNRPHEAEDGRLVPDRSPGVGVGRDQHGPPGEGVGPRYPGEGGEQGPGVAGEPEIDQVAREEIPRAVEDVDGAEIVADRVALERPPDVPPPLVDVDHVLFVVLAQVGEARHRGPEAARREEVGGHEIHRAYQVVQLLDHPVRDGEEVGVGVPLEHPLAVAVEADAEHDDKEDDDERVGQEEFRLESHRRELYPLFPDLYTGIGVPPRLNKIVNHPDNILTTFSKVSRLS